MTCEVFLRSNPSTMAITIYQAAWVLPITAPPIPQGALAIADDKIIFVGAQAEAATQPRLQHAEVIHLNGAALLPGFINTHTHLELNFFRGFLEDLAFREWILKLTTTKYERLTNDDLAASAMLGAAEALRAGVTCVADTGDSRAAFDALRQSGLRGVAYREVFGPNAADASMSLEGLKVKVAEMREEETELVRVGVSPHAPYTVSGELFRRVVEYAAQESLDVCIHTAESAAEENLLRDGSGEFAERLAARGIEWKAPQQSTIQYFAALGVLDVAPLLVHCVRVDDEDLALIGKHRARIAHCPKSNAKLGHGIAPLAKMLAANIRVGLGTDSVASNNRLDLMSEAQFCALLHRAASQHFKAPGAERLLQMMTLDGARVLGLEDKIGALEIGKQADFIALDLTKRHHQPLHDVMAAILFAATSDDVILTMVAGRVLFAEGVIQAFDEPEWQTRCKRLFPQPPSF
ncbi:MAG: amidohydrolase family protein [Acidobacteria bacterium]|nr:amidohydrolase family protein [Acidobacteriota bacterium]